MNPVCPYCRGDVAECDRLDCPGCNTPHHPECFAENGGCTIFGCSQAPADEAKISVTGADIGSPQPTSQPTPQPRSVSWAMGNSVLSLNATPSPAVEAAPAPVPPPASTPPPPFGASSGAAAPPMPAAAPTALRSAYFYPPAQPPKRRVIFVLLGIFLGIFGAHNFYAGYIKKAVIQLCLSVLTCFYGAIVSWVWAVVEICITNADADGEQFT